ncbi:MAG: glycosyltransferase [Alphaproteobacteria bacterium]
MKPDVLVSFLDSINILALIVSRIFPTRLIVSERYDPQTYPRNWFIKVLRHLTYPWADKIIVQSSSVAMFLGKRLETKIQIIGNPVAKPLTLASQDVPKDNIHLVSVGRLIPSKRMDMVIRAFKKVKDHYPASQLTILGEGPERPLLEKIREDLGLTNSVFLPGTSSNIGTDLIRGQIFLFASESEGFPNALCEAMAAGLVPIITDYGSSARDIIQHGINGFLVGKNDLEGLSNFAITLIENKKLREKLSLEACKIAQTYSMEHIVGEWEKNILSLVGAKY